MLFQAGLSAPEAEEEHKGPEGIHTAGMDRIRLPKVSTLAIFLDNSVPSRSIPLVIELVCSQFVTGGYFLA